MKKIILSALIATAIISCGSSDDKKTTESKTNDETTSTTDLSSNPDYQKGLALVAKSDCLTCHKVDEPYTGPSYRDVANKYADAGDTVVTYLADKIIKGGSGVWGGAMMMPHAGLSQDDAETMVKYILLLKK